MANLRDHIKTEIENGNLDELFSIADIKERFDKNGACFIGDGKYETRHIGTILANHSTGPFGRIGESVQRGGERLFIKKMERGYYELDYENYDFDKEDIDALTEELLIAETINIPSIKQDVASKFVEYLRHKPFRNMKIKNGHPHWSSAPAVTGWLARLNNYKWNGNDLESTKLKLDQFIEELAALESSYKNNQLRNRIESEALRIYDEIRKWGNPRGRNRTGEDVLEKLCNVWENKINEVDSTLTKLYALARPDIYVIYDSRVATAIVSIAEATHGLCEKPVGKNDLQRIDTIVDFRETFPHLGSYSGGSGGTRPRTCRFQNWPEAYRNIKAQYDANRLCKLITEKLNELNENDRNWSMREVEAVLFMEGY